MFFEQTRFLKEDFLKDLFVEQTLLSHNRYFPRNPLLFLEHIRIFQEHLFSHRTYSFSSKPYIVLEHITIIQETPMPRTDTHFPGRYPPSNRYLINRSRWLLSISVGVFIYRKTKIWYPNYTFSFANFTYVYAKKTIILLLVLLLLLLLIFIHKII